jgi:hypothetical protein
MRKLFYLGLCALSSIQAKAQQEEILKFTPQMMQSTWNCAANVSQPKVSIGLPFISQIGWGAYNTGFALGDVYTLRGDTAVIRPSNIISKLKENNFVGFNFNYTLFALSINTKPISIGFSLNDRFATKVTYPGALGNFIKDGNGATLGTPQNIGGFKLNVNYYREAAFHVQKKMGNFIFSASPKVLFGQLNLNTVKSELSLLTDTSYFKITGTSELEIQAAGVDTGVLFNNIAQGQISSIVFNTKNSGFGINLGAQYNTKKYSVTAGVNDIGFINWKQGATTISSPKVSIAFEGLDITQLVKGDSLNYQQTIDSVVNLFKLESKANSPYRSTLAMQAYAMGNYHFNKKHHIGGSISMAGFNKFVIPAFTACYQFTPSKHFNFALSYTAKRGIPFNMGTCITTRAAGVQWYILSDNLTSVFMPLKAKSVSINTGVNIAIGDFNWAKKDAKKRKDAIEEKPSKKKTEG